MSKIVLLVLWFYAILLFSCADNSLPEFPEFVGESTSVTESSSSGEASSSSVALSSSSDKEHSSSSKLSSSSVVTYTVTYNAGTTVTGVTVPLNQIKIYDVALTLSGAVPTRTDHTFAGWNTSANGTGVPYVPGAKYTENAGTTLYAQWTANRYIITYSANGGWFAPNDQTKTHDVALTLSTGEPTRTGYSFVGWNTLDNGTGTSYAPGDSYTANAYITLYAQWARTYTVTYKANNGSDAPGNQTKIHNVALTLNTTVPTREGYAFANWNTSGNGYEISYAPGASYTSNADITLYAQWNSLVVTNCDGQSFEKVEIGKQTWMTENLNCNVNGSKCYGNNEYNCDKYGRLYDWATAMALSASCNSSSCASQINAKHQGICPYGWHIPSTAEWEELIDYAGGYSTAGNKLKAASGWSDNGNGTDNFGFAALPGGHRRSDDGNFDFAGIWGLWWSASEDAYSRSMHYKAEFVGYGYGNKSFLQSVRCLQD